MARPKGVENKQTDYRTPSAKLTAEERLRFLANLIVDRILVDQQTDGKVLKCAERQRDGQPTIFA